jgi:hypothetical protein
MRPEGHQAINLFLRAINIRKEVCSCGGLVSIPIINVSLGRYHLSLDKSDKE